MVLSGNMDLQKLKMMLLLREKVENNDMNIEQASSCVNKK